MKYIALSPDGFTLEWEPKEHDTKEAAQEEIKEWVKRYAHQGHYSSLHGRIEYDKIESSCYIKEIQDGTIQKTD